MDECLGAGVKFFITQFDHSVWVFIHEVIQILDTLFFEKIYACSIFYTVVPSSGVYFRVS